LNIGGWIVPTDWSADGKFIAYNRIGADGSTDIWVLPTAERTPVPFARTTKDEAYATFSPDSHWIAYEESAGNGRKDVFVRSFPPGSGQPYQISLNGGSFAKWSSDGTEIFFVAPNGTMMAAPIDATRQSELALPTPPQALFKMPPLASLAGRPYDVSSDGKRILVNLPVEGAAPAPITVVVNWVATLQQ
jgi:Tol biopolymer transport system component